MPTIPLISRFIQTCISFHHYDDYFSELLAISVDNNPTYIWNNWIIFSLLCAKLAHLTVISQLGASLDVWTRIAHGEYAYFGERHMSRNLLFVTIMMQSAHNHLAMMLRNSPELIAMNKQFLFGDHCPPMALANKRQTRRFTHFIFTLQRLQFKSIICEFILLISSYL